MRDLIEHRLQEIEKNLGIYNAYLNNPANTEDNRKVVSFKVLYEMMAFTSIHALVPDYKPKAETVVTLTAGLAGTSGYVDVVNDQVVISPAYNMILAQKAEYLKNNKDGKVG